jgi:hypothetical protein
MKWVADGGWVATTNGLNRASNPSIPDEVGYDENGDGSINQVASVYVRTVPSGPLKLLQQGESRNMYGVVVVPALIQSVAAVNGDPETERPTPKRTGDQFTLVNGSSTLLTNYWVPFFSPKAKAMTDRLHEWNAVSDALPIPSYLLGNEYLAIANNYRDNAELSVDVTLAGKTLAYLLVDNRIGDNNATTPPDFTANMLWVAENGWTPVASGRNRSGIAEDPDEVGYDENGDGSINQVASVYYKVLDAGVASLGPQNEGRNICASWGGGEQGGRWQGHPCMVGQHRLVLFGPSLGQGRRPLRCRRAQGGRLVLRGCRPDQRQDVLLRREGPERHR